MNNPPAPRPAYTGYATADWAKRVSMNRSQPNKISEDLLGDYESDDDFEDDDISQHPYDTGAADLPPQSSDPAPGVTKVIDINEQLREPGTEEDIFEVHVDVEAFDQEQAAVDHEDGEDVRVQRRVHGKSFLREFEDPDIEICTPDTRCPYNPNRKIKDSAKRNWSSTPFLLIRNCTGLDEFRDIVIKILGPTRTSGEMGHWRWSKGQHLKPKAKGNGVGFQLYCSFGGRALEKKKQVISKLLY